jgi:hypothetical protein
MREVLGRLSAIGAQKRPPSLKVGEAFFYKNDLVYVVLCEYNFGNRDLHPCEDELDGAFRVDFQYDECRLHIKARVHRVICSESNLQDRWLNEVLTINVGDPPLNLDDLCRVRIDGTFRIGCQTYKVNEVTSSGIVIALCVFPASRRGEV